VLCPSRRARELSGWRHDRWAETKNGRDARPQTRKFALRGSRGDELSPGAIKAEEDVEALAAASASTSPPDAAGRRPYRVRPGVGLGVALRCGFFFTGVAAAAACSSCGYFFVLGQIRRHGWAFTVSVNSLTLVP